MFKSKCWHKISFDAFFFVQKKTSGAEKVNNLTFVFVKICSKTRDWHRHLRLSWYRHAQEKHQNWPATTTQIGGNDFQWSYILNGLLKMYLLDLSVLFMAAQLSSLCSCFYMHELISEYFGHVFSTTAEDATQLFVHVSRFAKTKASKILYWSPEDRTFSHISLCELDCVRPVESILAPGCSNQPGPAHFHSAGTDSSYWAWGTETNTSSDTVGPVEENDYFTDATVHRCTENPPKF